MACIGAMYRADVVRRDSYRAQQPVMSRGRTLVLPAEGLNARRPKWWPARS